MEDRNEEAVYRLNIPVTEDIIEFLHKVSLRAKSSGGKKLYKTTILRGFIEAIQDLENEGKLDLTGAKDVDSLKSCIINSFKNFS